MAHRTHRHPRKAIDPLIRMALRDMTPSNAQAAECLFQEAKAIYREACAFLDKTVEHAAQRLPQLEEHRRGAETIHRYPEKNLDVMLALMLIKLRGNVKAGEILIESGSFLEWGWSSAPRRTRWRMCGFFCREKGGIRRSVGDSWLLSSTRTGTRTVISPNGPRTLSQETRFGKHCGWPFRLKRWMS